MKEPKENGNVDYHLNQELCVFISDDFRAVFRPLSNFVMSQTQLTQLQRSIILRCNCLIIKMHRELKRTEVNPSMDSIIKWDNYWLIFRLPIHRGWDPSQVPSSWHMRVVDPTSTCGALQLNVTSDLKMKLRPSLCPLAGVPGSPQNLATEAEMWDIADVIRWEPTNAIQI